MVNNKLFFLTALAVLAADVITKLIVFLTKPFLNILPFFSIVYVENTGAGFGILKGQQLLLIMISLIALWLIYYYYDRIPKNNFAVVSVALIAGGIMGNLLDRLFRGYVIDFLDFFIKSYHWPAFNIADSAMVVGVVMLLVYELRK